MGWDENTRKKNSEVDFAYMAAIWTPNADAESLRMILDWNHWIFLLDDRAYSSCTFPYSHVPILGDRFYQLHAAYS